MEVMEFQMSFSDPKDDAAPLILSLAQDIAVSFLICLSSDIDTQ